MSNTFLGLPLLIWGGVCFGVAAVFLFVQPRSRSGPSVPPRAPWMRFVLRWFHTIVWLILGLACFLWASGASPVADVFAQSAFVLYLVFILVLLAVRKPRRPS